MLDKINLHKGGLYKPEWFSSEWLEVLQTFNFMQLHYTDRVIFTKSHPREPCCPWTIITPFDIVLLYSFDDYSVSRTT